MGCGRCGQLAKGRDLPTPPTAPATTGWVTFRLSSGYFFNCQGSDETAQVGHFSIVKWVLFRLTKTAAVQAKTSMGLQGMRERLVGLGGTLIADAAPGTGTRIAACLTRPADDDFAQGESHD